LSEIENGKRVPRDEIIRKFSEYYGIDEVILFDKFGRVSLSVVEGLVGRISKMKIMINKKFKQIGFY